MRGKSAKFGAAREIVPNGPIWRFRHGRKGSFKERRAFADLSTLSGYSAEHRRNRRKQKENNLMQG